jgi:hypothetical protein
VKKLRYLYRYCRLPALWRYYWLGVYHVGWLAFGLLFLLGGMLVIGSVEWGIPALYRALCRDSLVGVLSALGQVSLATFFGLGLMRAGISGWQLQDEVRGRRSALSYLRQRQQKILDYGICQEDEIRQVEAILDTLENIQLHPQPVANKKSQQLLVLTSKDEITT